MMSGVIKIWTDGVMNESETGSRGCFWTKNAADNAAGPSEVAFRACKSNNRGSKQNNRGAK